MSGDLGLSPGFDGEGWPACSPGLRKLLTEGDNAYSAARLVAINKTLRAECAELLPRLENVTDPAGPGELLELLNSKAPTFSVPVAGEAFWSAYLHDLSGFSIHAMRGAFCAWAKPESHQKHPDMATIFPTPAQLAPFALAHRNALAQMRYRARKAMDQVQQAPAKITEEERRQVAADFADLARNIKPKGIPQDLRPRLSPQETAEKIRNAAPAPAADEDPGDVV